MVKYKRNLLSVALASATLWMASAAQAQEQATVPADAQTTTDATAKPKKPATKPEGATNLDKVVVTGIRRGIERSIDTKKNSTSIVEAVSAEDIGKLPDVSIAGVRANLSIVMPVPRMMMVSARTGEGIDRWVRWLEALRVPRATAHVVGAL